MGLHSALGLKPDSAEVCSEKDQQDLESGKVRKVLHGREGSTLQHQALGLLWLESPPNPKQRGEFDIVAICCEAAAAKMLSTPCPSPSKLPGLLWAQVYPSDGPEASCADPAACRVHPCSRRVSVPGPALVSWGLMFKVESSILNPTWELKCFRIG